MQERWLRFPPENHHTFGRPAPNGTPSTARTRATTGARGRAGGSRREAAAPSEGQPRGVPLARRRRRGDDAGGAANEGTGAEGDRPRGRGGGLGRTLEGCQASLSLLGIEGQETFTLALR